MHTARYARSTLRLAPRGLAPGGTLRTARARAHVPCGLLLVSIATPAGRSFALANTATLCPGPRIPVPHPPHHQSPQPPGMVPNHLHPSDPASLMPHTIHRTVLRGCNSIEHTSACVIFPAVCGRACAPRVGWTNQGRPPASLACWFARAMARARALSTCCWRPGPPLMGKSHPAFGCWRGQTYHHASWRWRAHHTIWPAG